MSKLFDYFNISYGQRKYHDKSRLIHGSGNIPLISSKGKDNGVYGFFDIEPMYQNVISVPNTGTIGFAFYQGWKCCIDDNCLVLTPKCSMNISKMLFFILLIRKSSYKYVYGRQITPERLGNTHVPGKIPSWVNSIKVKEYFGLTLKQLFLNKKMCKPETGTKENGSKCALSDIFEIANGLASSEVKRYKTQLSNEYIPYLRPSNNQKTSIDAFVNKSKIDAKYLQKPDTLYVSTDGQGSHSYAYVSTFEFVPNSNISVLTPKRNMSVQEKLYYALCITKNRYKYSYGRKPKGNRLKTLLLPAKPPKYVYENVYLEIVHKWQKDLADELFP